MKTRRTRWTRLAAAALSLVMMVGLLPTTASAAVTHENDWKIFSTDDPDAPETQQLLLRRMIQNDNFYKNGWQKLGNAIRPYGYTIDWVREKITVPYNLSDISDRHPIQYSNQGLRDTVSQAFEQCGRKMIRDKSGVMDRLPEQGEKSTDVLYIADSASNFTPDHQHRLESMSMVLFYDFKVEGIPERFETPEIELHKDTEESLKDKGITFTMGGSSDSYTVTVKNDNSFANTVDKEYSYKKSSSTSTSVSSSYSKNWTEETSVSVSFEVPLISLSSSVEQSFSYSYGMEKTYSDTKQDGTEQSISDTVSVPLPPHTKVDVNVQVMDRQTKIPYSGASRITYKVLYIFVGGAGPTGGSDRMLDCEEASSLVYEFGRGGSNAVKDLDLRVANADLPGYNDDMPQMVDWVKKPAFQEAKALLTSGQPWAPYLGDFYYNDKNTIITPQKVVPLYPLDNLVFDTEQFSIYEQQTRRLDPIHMDAYNEYDVAYYDFNPNLHGHWQVVDAARNDASEYAVIEKDINEHPVLHALKAPDNKDLYLTFVPDIKDVTPTFRSNLIALDILPTPLSQVNISGELDAIILDDGPNTANVSGLTVTAKDLDGKPFDTTDRIKWMAEPADGFTIDIKTGDMSFTQPGAYQIYAVVNNQESNRILLEVLPPRAIETLTVTGTIPTLFYNTTDENTFELNKLAVSAVDQYGDPWALDPDLYQWVITPVESVAANSEIQGNRLVGKVVGKDTLRLEYPTGKGDEVLTSEALLVDVGAKAYVTTMYQNGEIPGGVEGVDYDLTQLILTAFDQYEQPISVPADIQWALTPDSVQDGVAVSGNLLTVAPGTIPYAGSLTVKVRASSPSCGVETDDISVTFLQPAQLALLTVSQIKPFGLRKDQNGYVADYFTVVGKDQYGRDMAVSPEWKCKKGTSFAVNNTAGTITVLSNNSSDEIYALQDDISSNALTVQVGAGREFASISVSNVPARAKCNSSLDLSTLDVQILDQDGVLFTEQDLIDEGVRVNWVLGTNKINASVNGDELFFGSKRGTLKLTPHVVSRNDDHLLLTGATHTIYVRGRFSASSVAVSFTENGQDVGTPVELKLNKNATYVAADQVEQYLPDGYKFAQANQKYTIVNGTAEIPVVKESVPDPVPAGQPITVTFKLANRGGRLEGTRSRTLTVILQPGQYADAPFASNLFGNNKSVNWTSDLGYNVVSGDQVQYKILSEMMGTVSADASIVFTGTVI